MSATRQEIERLLTLVREGRLDDLSPEQVAELEAWLCTSPTDEARLADARPPADPWLTAPLPEPAPAEWERVWANVNRAADQRKPAHRRWVPMWQALTAVAACVLLATSWHVLQPARTDEAWALRPAREVRIDSLELFGDTTVLVDTTAENGGLPVIWVLDMQGA
jgi:hypothetical protein